jgi:hypothetical protein
MRNQDQRSRALFLVATTTHPGMTISLWWYHQERQWSNRRDHCRTPIWTPFPSQRTLDVL